MPIVGRVEGEGGREGSGERETSKGQRATKGGLSQAGHSIKPMSLIFPPEALQPGAGGQSQFSLRGAKAEKLARTVDPRAARRRPWHRPTRKPAQSSKLDTERFFFVCFV